VRNPDNPALEDSSPMTRSFGFYQEKASPKKQAYLFDMFNEATKNVCTSTILVSPYPLSLTSAQSSALKTPKNTEEDPNDPDPDEGEN